MSRATYALRLTRLVTVTLVIALLALLVWTVIHGSAGGSFVKRIERGEKPPAPGFGLAVVWPKSETWPRTLRPSLTDGRLELAELRGRPVVINFWASWCHPCKQEAGAFAAVAARYGGQVAFVGIDVQDLESSAEKFLKRYKVNYVVVRDRSDKTYTAYGLTGIPETFFVDRRGRAVAHAVGRTNRNELEAQVKSLVTDLQG